MALRIGTPLALATAFFVLSVAFRLVGADPNVALLGSACAVSAAYAWALAGEAGRRRRARRAEVKIESRTRKPRRPER